MAKSRLRLVAPGTVNRTVTPRRPPNADLRTREYLTEAEVERLLRATRNNRWAHRDATMILVAYRHGLRASELTDLRWDQVDFRTATLLVRRVKQGSPSTHPIIGDELRWLRRLQRDQEPKSPFVFTSERGSPFTVRAQRRSSGSRRTPTCSGMPVGLPWRPRGMIRAPFRPISGTRTSSTQCATPSCPRPGSKRSGAFDALGSILSHPDRGERKNTIGAPLFWQMPLTKPTVYGKASIELARAATNTQMLRITLRVGTQAVSARAAATSVFRGERR